MSAPFWEKRGALIQGKRSLNTSCQKERDANSREALCRVNTVIICLNPLSPPYVEFIRKSQPPPPPSFEEMGVLTLLNKCFCFLIEVQTGRLALQKGSWNCSMLMLIKQSFISQKRGSRD